MNQTFKIFFGIAIVLLVGMAIGYFAHDPETITEYVEYQKFNVLLNCTITAIEQSDNSTLIYFNTTTQTTLNSITITGKHFGTATDWQKTYNFLIAQKQDETWQLIYYETIGGT